MGDAIDSKSILGCQGAGSSPVVGKLFLLDFDGLLVDTERLHHIAYQEALAKWGYFFTVDFPTYASLAHHSSGKALREHICKLFPELTERWTEFRKDKLLIYSHLIEEKVTLMPFAYEFLSFLHEKKIPSCVVTNSPKKDTDTIRHHLPHLNLIPHWITREDYNQAKPAPDGYLKGLSLFPQISKEFVFGVEDTLRGIESLKSAGIQSILISTLCTGGDFHFASLGQLRASMVI